MDFFCSWDAVTRAKAAAHAIYVAEIPGFRLHIYSVLGEAAVPEAVRTALRPVIDEYQERVYFVAPTEDNPAPDSNQDEMHLLWNFKNIMHYVWTAWNEGVEMDCVALSKFIVQCAGVERLMKELQAKLNGLDEKDRQEGRM